MLLWFIQPLRAVAKALTSADSPRQMAAGFALGMMIGLVPKGNLTAILLAVLLLSMRVNLATGGLATMLFAWVGMVVDPLTHHVGGLLLSHPNLAPLWTWLYNQPVVPWTAFNNTVVMGSCAIGLWLLLPVYLVTRPLFAHHQPLLVERIKRYRLYQVLFGADVVTSWRTA